MCSVYQFGKGKVPRELKEEGDAIASFVGEVSLVRRTDKAPVYLESEGMVSMRWGFERPSLGVVNNTRSENLDSPMWRESYAERRCLIPLLAFYEWSGAKGHKKTHRFISPDNETLWVAGLWEDAPELGPCYSMLTTSANSLMAPIHNRMPAILNEAERLQYLDQGLDVYEPLQEMLCVNDAPNPLLKNPPTHIQDELF